MTETIFILACIIIVICLAIFEVNRQKHKNHIFSDRKLRQMYLRMQTRKAKMPRANIRIIKVIDNRIKGGN